MKIRIEKKDRKYWKSGSRLINIIRDINCSYDFTLDK